MTADFKLQSLEKVMRRFVLETLRSLEILFKPTEVSNEAQPTAPQFERLTIEKSIARSHAMSAPMACSMPKLRAAPNTDGELRVADASSRSHLARQEKEKMICRS